jgi:PAS domain S-box-containing protein
VPSLRPLDEALFRLIASTASEGIIIIDQKSAVVFINSAAAALFGYEPEELLGGPVTTLIPEELRETHRAAISRYLRTGERTGLRPQVDFEGIHKSGPRVPLQISFAEARAGSQVFFAGFLRDRSESYWIQARLAAQFAVANILSTAENTDHALQQVLARAGEHLDFATGVIWFVDKDCLRWHSGWQAAHVSAEEFQRASRERTFSRGEGLPGRIWAAGEPASIEAVDTDSNFPRVKAAVAGGLRSGLGFPLSRDGELIGVIEYFSSNVRRLDPSLIQILTAIGQQISQFLARAHAQEALRASEAMHRIIFENANDAFGVSSDEKFVQVNQAFASMFGYRSPEEMAGLSIYDTLPPTQREVIRGHRQRRLAGLPEPMRYHSRGRREDGAEFLSEVRATDFWMKGKMYTLAILRDITMERQAQDVLTQSNAALRRANADLEQFAYASSHDLQEPLRVISLYSELLHRRYHAELSDDAKDLLGTVTNAARRINELVKDLLSYTQAASLDATAPTGVDASRVMDEVRAILADRISALHATVTCDELPRVLVHRTHLVQLFQNLLSNGLKYHKPDHPPRIHVSSRPLDSKVELIVRDEGIGIPPEYHERIFGVFKRLHSQRVPGTGIGLAICKKIVEYYDGEIRVESEDGAGTAFHVVLPGV